ncbi:hypothetical protein LTR09_011210 [Extremus antarcticus]|uniref:Arrestin-like N-terminal domain-containing protein n=1 Tax=Extremus antarcticus TaxID=702011 RepID=A0AAJ0DCC7_9PEZI|nr:hypothetical protein LTR09_011210 [Extremus antarcticus]
MARIGKVGVTVTLARHEIQSPDDPVRGTVSLRFFATNPSQGLLFGPLQLAVVLRGRMSLQVAENRTSHAYIWFYETCDLFRKTYQLFDGPFRAVSKEAPQQLSFETHFPHSTGLSQLPPSFSTRFQADAVRQAGKHQGMASIEYSLHVEASMPGIDVEVANETQAITIQYEQASRSVDSLTSREVAQVLRVQSYALLPEQERPNGLIDRTRAVLRNVPKPLYAFTVTCSKIPTAIAVGQAFQIEIRVQTDVEATTATQIPEITVGTCKVFLISRTELYATNQKGVDSPRLDNSTTVGSVEGREDITGQFTKEKDFTKTLRFDAFATDIPSSFHTSKLSRSYRIRLDLQFVVAEQVVDLKKEVLVRMLPRLPPVYQADECPPAGPSRAREDGTLPAYEDHRRSIFTSL